MIMACGCIPQANDKLLVHGRQLVTNVLGDPERVVLATMPREGIRAKKGPTVYASHCPFCGAAYDAPATPPPAGAEPGALIGLLVGGLREAVLLLESTRPASGLSDEESRRLDRSRDVLRHAEYSPLTPQEAREAAPATQEEDLNAFVGFADALDACQTNQAALATLLDWVRRFPARETQFVSAASYWFGAGPAGDGGDQDA